MNERDVTSDSDLLRGYLRRQDENAFAELVRRHIAWVYHLALRQLRDPADAEDATQAVFILLLRKAGRFRDAQPISPWLFHSTMFICRDVRKRRQRRAIHERKAAAMRPENNLAENSPMDISRHLDDAIDRLRQIDRQTIVLRFFQGLSHEQIAETLGISEDAAKMRLSRAVERLRTNFLGTKSLSAPALEQALAVQGALAPLPSHLIERVVTNGMSGARASTAHLSWLIHWKIAAAILIGGSSLCIGIIAAHSAAHPTSSAVAAHSITQQSSTSAPSPAVYYLAGGLLRGTLNKPGVWTIGQPANSIRQAILVAELQTPTPANVFIEVVHRLSKNSENICVYHYQSLMTPSPVSPAIFPLDRKIFPNDTMNISDDPRFNKTIAPGDLLMVAVADSDQPGRSVDLRLTVSPAGNVLIPEAGTIHFVGQTMPQAEKLVRDAYIKANLIPSPMVSVGRIKSATAATPPTTQHSPAAPVPLEPAYTIYGSVERPGEYLIPGPKMSLRQLILISGPKPTNGPNTFIALIHPLSKKTYEICVYRYLPLMTASPSSPNVFPLDRTIFLNDMASISDDPRFSKPIAPGDLLMVAVADSDQPGRSVDLRLTVSSAGSVLIPEAGVIHLVGQTMPQAEKLVRDAYIKANLIPSPMVSVGRIKSATDK